MNVCYVRPHFPPWLVDNDGEKYTVSREFFPKTYKMISPGVYVKSVPVWAEVAAHAGKVKTLESETAYQPGDFLVSNNQDGTDAYAVEAEKFKALYELAED